jgi:hypothetical protein
MDAQSQLPGHEKQALLLDRGYRAAEGILKHLMTHPTEQSDDHWAPIYLTDGRIPSDGPVDSEPAGTAAWALERPASQTTMANTRRGSFFMGCSILKMVAASCDPRPAA